MEMIDWDKIDASPEAERDERVVRLLWRNPLVCRWSDAVGEQGICDSSGWFYISNGIGALCGTETNLGTEREAWQEARQHPIGQNFEAQSRAEWAQYKAAQGHTLIKCERCMDTGRRPPWPGSNGLVDCDHSPAPPQAQPLGDGAKVITAAGEPLDIVCPACGEKPGWPCLTEQNGESVERKAHWARVHKSRRIVGLPDLPLTPTPQPEAAGTVEMPGKPRRPVEWGTLGKGYLMQPMIGGGYAEKCAADEWVHYASALRTRLAEVEAQRDKLGVLIDEACAMGMQGVQALEAAEQSLATITAERDAERKAHEVTRQAYRDLSDLKLSEGLQQDAELERLKGEMVLRGYRVEVHLARNVQFPCWTTWPLSNLRSLETAELDLAAAECVRDADMGRIVTVSEHKATLKTLNFPAPTAETEKPGGGEDYRANDWDNGGGFDVAGK